MATRSAGSLSRTFRPTSSGVQRALSALVPKRAWRFGINRQQNAGQCNHAVACPTEQAGGDTGLALSARPNNAPASFHRAATRLLCGLAQTCTGPFDHILQQWSDGTQKFERLENHAQLAAATRLYLAPVAGGAVQAWCGTVSLLKGNFLPLVGVSRS